MKTQLAVLFLSVPGWLPLLAQTSLKVPDLKHAIDIAAHTGTRFNADSGCSTQPFAQDAHIWSVVVKTSFADIPGLTKLDPNFPVYFDTAKNLYLVVFDGQRGETTLTDKGNSLKVLIRNVDGQAWMEVASLTLAQVGDVADAIATNGAVVGNILGQQGFTMRFYRVAAKDEKGNAVEPLDLYQFLQADIDPANPSQATVLQDRLASAAKADLRLTRRGVAATVSSSLLDSRSAGMIQLDQPTIKTLKDNVSRLAATGSGTTKAADGPPVFVIDEPCLTLSISPVLSGKSQSLATTFRFRYDFYSQGGQSFLKVRANGDGDIGGGYFNRAEGFADLGVNNKGAVAVAGGATAGYSFTRVAGKVVDQWNAGGKFQVHLPAILFTERPGSLVRPLLNFEGGASGGNRLQDGVDSLNGAPVAITAAKTAFLARGSFLYTARPSPRLSFDLQAQAGASDAEMFATRRYFSNIRVEARYNVSKDYDFLARYDCGRRDPDYRKFCGWQTGFILVTGR